MRAAVIFAVPLTMSAEDCWRWRSTDGMADSAESFTTCDDCAADARAHGYRGKAGGQTSVALSRLRGPLAGGPESRTH